MVIERYCQVEVYTAPEPQWEDDSPTDERPLHRATVKSDSIQRRDDFPVKRVRCMVTLFKGRQGSQDEGIRCQSTKNGAGNDA